MHAGVKLVFNVGDPVQSKLGLPRLGKVLKISPSSNAWVQVQLIGEPATAIFWPEELYLCKCVARIPKGVSQCQK